MSTFSIIFNTIAVLKNLRANCNVLCKINRAVSILFRYLCISRISIRASGFDVAHITTLDANLMLFDPRIAICVI